DGTSGLLPDGAILTALVLFSSGSLCQDRSDWNGRSRRRRCPRGTEVDLKFGDGARETDRHARDSKGHGEFRIKEDIISVRGYSIPKSRLKEEQGCCHEVENEKASFEQRIFVQRASQIRSPKANPSFKKAHPCEICVQILRDFLYLDEYQGTHSKQKLHSCGTCGKQLYVSTNLHQHQKQCIREKPFRRDVDRASFVKNCKCHVSGKPLVFRVVGKDFLASSQFLQQWATHTWERSNSRT
ncbi:hypothetical protein E2I00_008030, partial [Balaenoptera physalus]